MEKELEEIMKKMEEINYGWIDINNQVHKNTIENLQKLYRVASIDEILANKVGICFDQVELERYYFKNEYKTSSYAIIASHMVHTFLTLQKENKYIYFEHSSYFSKGIYFFDSLDELLEYAINDFMERHNVKNKNSLKLVNYAPLQKGTTFEELKKILLN